MSLKRQNKPYINWCEFFSICKNAAPKGEDCCRTCRGLCWNCNTKLPPFNPIWKKLCTPCYLERHAKNQKCRIVCSSDEE